jgi:hypothetical protein
LVERLADNLVSMKRGRITLEAQAASLRSEVATLRTSNGEALVLVDELRQKKESIAEEKRKLENKLKVLESDKAEISQNASDMEEKISLLEIAADFAQLLRVRFFHSESKGQSNWELINDGNRAAHDGNLVLDVVLFSLGILDTSEQTWCEDRFWMLHWQIHRFQREA